MSNQTIICPNCKTQISVDEVIKNQIRGEVEVQLSQKIKAELAKENEDKINFLNQSLKEKELKLDEARKIELGLRKDRQNLEEEKKNFELEKQRQIDLERKKIEENALKKADEQQGYKIAELQKQLEDASKLNADLNRKLQQGSQQTQGEVLELELEELLRSTFPFDEIVPIQKGVSGADIIQKVHDRNGRDLGSIIWESKHTKAWSESWIQKLKDDQRNQKAEVAIIVSTVLPTDIKCFGYKSDILVSDMASVVSLAFVVRNMLGEVSTLRLASIGKNEKMEVLYNYLTGIEFKQKVEAIVESFTNMKADLEQEKRAMVKIWAKREKQIERVVNNTVGMHGDLKGLIGNSLPEIETLELPQADEEII